MKTPYKSVLMEAQIVHLFVCNSQGKGFITSQIDQSTRNARHKVG